MGLPIKVSPVGPTKAAIISGLPEPPRVSDPDAALELLLNTMVLYGPTGTRKTSQIGEFSKYIYEKTGKITRLITMDGGGYGSIQDFVNAGIIEPWRLVEEENPKVALVKASKGAWPKSTKNGLRQGAVVEPTREQRPQVLKDVGAYAIEGWASICKAVMRDAVSKGQKVSEDIVGKFTETSDMGSETFGAPARSHYGFVQNLLLDLIRNFSSLPTERTLYTSLEGKGEDRLTKTLQYGPEAAGQAITAAIPTYVGDCLHFEDFTEDGGVDPNNTKQKLVLPQVRAWFTQHPDSSTGVMWPAKVRLIPARLKEFRERIGKSGYFILRDVLNPKEGQATLYDYLKLQDEMLTSGSDEARKFKEMCDEKGKENNGGKKKRLLLCLPAPLNPK